MREKVENILGQILAIAKKNDKCIEEQIFLELLEMEDLDENDWKELSTMLKEKGVVISDVQTMDLENLEDLDQEEIEEEKKDDLELNNIDEALTDREDREDSGNSENQEEQETEKQEVEDSAEVVNTFRQYLREVGERDRLADEKVLELAKRIEQGDKSAEREMIESNLRLVISIAKKYKFLGNELGDRIQDGNMGLMKAVETFDYKRGFKFSTHAHRLIAQAILEGNRAFKELSRQSQSMIVLYKRTEEKLRNQKKEEPTPQEIATELKWDQKTLQRVMDGMRGNTSMEQKVGDEDGSVMGDFIQDYHSGSEYEKVENKELWNVVRKILTSDEMIAVTAHLGKGDDIMKTWEDVAKEQNWTKKRAQFFGVMGLSKIAQKNEKKK